MLKFKFKFITLSFLVVLSFVSSYKLVLQTYEHRSTFAHLEKLQLEKEDLSFQSNILLEEVKYFNNHISLRKFASENLGMVVPNIQESIYISSWRIE